MTASKPVDGSPQLQHPGFQPMLQSQTADDPARGDRDAEAETEIGQCHLPADQPEQQAECHLVHHRGGNQEREGDAKRHAGGNEADEQRHGRAGAERRDDAERCGEHIALPPRAGPPTGGGCVQARRSCARRPSRTRPASAAAVPSACHRQRRRRRRASACRVATPMCRPPGPRTNRAGCKVSPRAAEQPPRRSAT